MGKSDGMKSGIVVVGAGGHAKVCLELLHEMGEKIAYCIGGSESAEDCGGILVLKGDDHLVRLREEGYFRLFVAIGSNRIRQNLASLCIALGYELVNAISPRAIVSPTALIGRGVAIMGGAVINAESVIADLAIINTGAIIDHDCSIGAVTHIGPQCGLAGNVIVGRESFLGIGCKVIPGIRIGENVLVGAGAVVISDIGSGTTAVGMPAKVVKQQFVGR
jgi:UDP-perosamine 4-acetyltransferase